VRYTTDLTDEVWYYLRGEEYSAQIDYFVRSIQQGRTDGSNTFRSALAADRVRRDDRRGSATRAPGRRPRPRQREEPLRTPVQLKRRPRFNEPMDRVLFGDNQFFGVNHMSEEKARAQQMRFQDLGAIIDVLDAPTRRASAPSCARRTTASSRSAITSARTATSTSGLPVLPVHAVRAQVRERGDGVRDDRRPAQVPAGRRRDRRDAQGAASRSRTRTSMRSCAC
jgi:hypothetical protein